MKFFNNYKRAKRLIAEDDQRIALEKAQQEKEITLLKEIDRIDEKHINYLKDFTELDITAKQINFATLYRELNRVKLSIFSLAPTLYHEAFKSAPCACFDTVYIRNAEMSSCPKSLNETEKVLNECIGRENWPPQKINLDCFEEAAYYSFHSSVKSDIKKLKKLLSIIATLV